MRIIVQRYELAITDDDDNTYAYNDDLDDASSVDFNVDDAPNVGDASDQDDISDLDNQDETDNSDHDSDSDYISTRNGNPKKSNDSHPQPAAAAPRKCSGGEYILVPTKDSQKEEKNPSTLTKEHAGKPPFPFLMRNCFLPSPKPTRSTLFSRENESFPAKQAFLTGGFFGRG